MRGKRTRTSTTQYSTAFHSASARPWPQKTAISSNAMQTVALDGCRIDRAIDRRIEIIQATRANRKFPARITESLGVCLKMGPSHHVVADGRDVVYPSAALCVRQPGCVWSTAGTGPVGFLSIDLPSAVLPEALKPRTMVFGDSTALPQFLPLVAAIRRARSSAYLDELVTLLLVDLQQAGAIAAGELHRSAPGRAAMRARAILEESVAEPPSIVALAGYLGLSRFALMRRFRDDFGITPHAFVLRLRIERARERLAQGADLREVALELGFADQPHFTRAFKSVLGMTPGEYARRVRRVVAMA
jgi:AraC-like DNA-binding protein